MRDDCVHGAGQEGFPADTVQGLFSVALELSWSISGANSITVPFFPLQHLKLGSFWGGPGQQLEIRGMWRWWKSESCTGAAAGHSTKNMLDLVSMSAKSCPGSCFCLLCFYRGLCNGHPMLEAIMRRSFEPAELYQRTLLMSSTQCCCWRLREQLPRAKWCRSPCDVWSFTETRVMPAQTYP